MQGVGKRLQKLRKQHNYSLDEMAARLGIKMNSYYKNESDTTLPGAISLEKLYKDFGLSINWLLFNHGPMFLKDIPEKQEADKTTGSEEPSAEIKELLEHMGRNPLLRHKILIYFHENKHTGEKQEDSL